MEKSSFDKLAVVELRNRTTSTTKLSIRDKAVSLSYITHDREAVKLAISKYKGRVLDLAYCNNKIYILTNSSLYAYDIVTASVKSIKAPVDAYSIDITPVGSNIIIVTTTTGERVFYTTDLIDFPFTNVEIIRIILKDFSNIICPYPYIIGLSTCGHLYIGTGWYPTRLMSSTINKYGWSISGIKQCPENEYTIRIFRKKLSGSLVEEETFNILKECE